MFDVLHKTITEIKLCQVREQRLTCNRNAPGFRIAGYPGQPAWQTVDTTINKQEYE